MCARPLHPPTRRRHQRGLSLIELMVGIVVSMLIGLAAAGSAMMFTASQRQGVGVGGVSINAASALSGIKSDAALAGLGFFRDSTALCTSLNLSSGATVISNGANFAPLQATRDTNHDILNIVYASTISAGTYVPTNLPSDDSTSELEALLPVAVNQTVLLAPRKAGLCTVRTVTAVTPSTATTPQILTYGADGRHNGSAFTTPATYGTRARVALLGDVRWSRYRVTGGNLVLERPVDGTSAVLVRDVVAFRVQYGVSATTTSATLDEWVNAEGAWATITSANIDRVRALRIGMIVRSPQREKPADDGSCSATTAAPQLFGNTADTFTGSEWKCWRYRTTTTIVPLRNYVLGE